MLPITTDDSMRAPYDTDTVPYGAPYESQLETVPYEEDMTAGSVPAYDWGSPTSSPQAPPPLPHSDTPMEIHLPTQEEVEEEDEGTDDEIVQEAHRDDSYLSSNMARLQTLHH